MGNCCKPPEPWETPKGRRLKKILDQEQVMIKAEREFKLETLQIANLFNAICTEAPNSDTLTEAALSRLFRHFELPLSITGSTKFRAFFHKFRSGDDFAKAKILALVVLFGKAGVTDKAQLYAQIADPTNTGSVSALQFETLYKLCEDIATSWLQDFVLDDQGKQIFHDKINIYIFNLRKTRANALIKLRKDIFGDAQEVSRDRFADVLGLKTCLQNPWQLRMYMETVFKTTPVEQKKINTAGAFDNLFASLAPAAPTAPAASKKAPQEVELTDRTHS